jgi:acyl-coenzyme A thioesterase PaaI-like protein
MGFALYTTLAADESFTMLELKINFLRPVWKATLRAKARVIHAGRFVGYVECEVVDEQERLVAGASSSCLTLGDGSPKDAGDRRSQREDLRRDRDPMSRSKRIT